MGVRQPHSMARVRRLRKGSPNLSHVCPNERGALGLLFGLGVSKVRLITCKRDRNPLREFEYWSYSIDNHLPDFRHLGCLLRPEVTQSLEPNW